MENIKEKYRWLGIYTLQCTKERPELIDNLPKIKQIKEFLNEDYSKGKVRDYFFMIHNPQTLEFMQKIGSYETREDLHLIIPYHINDVLGGSVTCTIHQPFYDIPIINTRIFTSNYIENAILYEIIEEMPKREDILLIHGKYVVDVVKEKDLRKYHYLYKKEK